VDPRAKPPLWVDDGSRPITTQTVQISHSVQLDQRDRHVAVGLRPRYSSRVDTSASLSIGGHANAVEVNGPTNHSSAPSDIDY